ncbi:hypothetical protein [Mesorhizobium sp. B4-1-4]|uniref:hypothetical protein n=1 Tax=Mesorhizobium sp. B4-1-4 TaxID=2589888 RepID=UPI001126E09F|nr:hypothetical protein [Mesorhizobium sp. B4-1-4]UCI30945.1 hypothetical protein FJW03_24670 [Mesorhizobium sp. B4-1-4]
MAVLAFLTACGPDDAAKSEKFSLIDEEIYDAPIKTQISQNIVALGVPTKEELEAEILKRYRAAEQRTAFRYHSSPTNIYLYVYGSEEQARAGQGLWIAMLAKNYSDTGDPKVVIEEGRLAALSAAPEDRFGLSEEMRRAIFKESGEAEARATREAMERVPNTEPMAQAKLEVDLAEKFKADLVAKQGISEQQLLEIQAEGVTKGWPM